MKYPGYFLKLCHFFLTTKELDYLVKSYRNDKFPNYTLELNLGHSPQK